MIDRKKEVQRSIGDYLHRHFIKVFKDDHDGVDRFTMRFTGYENAPEQVIESCIYFFSDGMEVRTYYCATGSECIYKSEKKPDLYTTQRTL